MTNEEYKVWYEKTRNEMAEKMRDGFAQASKPWVDLTREEMFECGGGMLTKDEERLCRYIEAKLKEKNT